jgi:cytochrome c oxidase subunit 2
MKRTARLFAGATALLATFLVSTFAVFAAQPEPWQIWHQEAGSEAMAAIDWFDLYTLVFITLITIFVLVLLAVVLIKFRASNNPEPSRTSHNTLLEVVWTVTPIAILIAIALPSFNLLEKQFDPGEEPTVTVKAIGQTWYWDYEYQDESEISFSSNMLLEEDREGSGKEDKARYPRLLAVDNELVVPVGETVRVLVTADPAGVIHNFAMPAFGLKMDAIPGRTNETWFKARKEGMYYGQCSELCGVNHAFMPIAIRVVSREQYDAWQTAAAEDVGEANRALMASIEADKNMKLAQNQTSSGDNQ